MFLSKEYQFSVYLFYIKHISFNLTISIYLLLIHKNSVNLDILSKINLRKISSRGPKIWPFDRSKRLSIAYVDIFARINEFRKSMISL